ncbi:hypothetical protein GRC12_28620 [Streptomyces griseorubiginosus]|nr:hypothetical protein [Streptomyces griseorubiginosus]
MRTGSPGRRPRREPTCRRGPTGPREGALQRSLSMSTNPFVDHHLVYAVVLIALAAPGAGATWGPSRAWARLPFVSRRPWLQ